MEGSITERSADVVELEEPHQKFENFVWEYEFW